MFSPAHWVFLLSRQLSSLIFIPLVYFILEGPYLTNKWKKSFSYSSIILFNFLSNSFRKLTPLTYKFHEEMSHMCIASTSVSRAVRGTGYMLIMWMRSTNYWGMKGVECDDREISKEIVVLPDKKRKKTF